MEHVRKRICSWGRCMNKHSILEKDCGAMHTLVIADDQTIVCDGLTAAMYFIETIKKDLPSSKYYFEQANRLTVNEPRAFRATATIVLVTNRDNMPEIIKYARNMSVKTLIVDLSGDTSIAVTLADTLPGFKIARRLGEARDRLKNFLSWSDHQIPANLNA